MADKSNERSNGPGLPQGTDEDAGEEIRRYREILLKDPSSLVFAALAEAYRKRRLLGHAIEVCKTGLRYHPDFASGRVALARAYYDSGEIEKAQRELERVVCSVPDNLVAQKLLRAIYRQRQDLDNLEKTAHRILSFDPRDEESKETLLWIESRRAGTAGSGAAGDDETGSEKREIVTKTLADIYAAQGYYEKAYEIYWKLWRKDPDNTVYHERLADLKEKIGQRVARVRERKGSEEPSPGAGQETP